MRGDGTGERGTVAASDGSAALAAALETIASLQVRCCAWMRERETLQHVHVCVCVYTCSLLLDVCMDGHAWCVHKGLKLYMWLSR